MGVPIVIRGYFRPIVAGRTNVGKRPYVNALLDIPSLGISRFGIRFLVDTGADSVMLGTSEAQRLIEDLQVDLGVLPLAHTQGVGGQARIRAAQAIVTVGEFSTTIEIGILEPPPRPEEPLPVPSLLGRSVISQFALIVDERTDRVLLLDPDEFDAIDIPR